MKKNYQYIYFTLLGAGFFLLALFLYFRPWVYLSEGRNITTVDELYKNAGSKIAVTTTVYPTGYSIVNNKGEIKIYYYFIIIEDKMVIVPYKEIPPGDEIQKRYVTGLITEISKSESMKRFRVLMSEKYGSQNPSGSVVPEALSPYYIETDFFGMGIFVFTIGVLSVFVLFAGFFMRSVYKKRESENKISMAGLPEAVRSEVEESLLKDYIYSDDFLTMSKRYLKYGKNDEIIKMANIEGFKLMYNELIITLKNGSSIVIPAIDEKELRSIQKCYNALLIYMPEITGN